MNTFTSAVTELRRQFSPEQLITNAIELATYQTDAANDAGTPDGVFFPKSVADVKVITRWAAQHSIPLIARGAGTGLSGGAVAVSGGIIVEFSRLNHVLDFDIEAYRVTLEPGVINLKLDELVRKSGLYFPPDPASGRSATIGGNIAENAGGPHCFKYGVTTNYLTGLATILADGRQVCFGGQALDYPQYDFLGLVAGNEGSLCLITQATFRLLRNPPGVKTMMAAFDTAEAAGKAVSAIIAQGLVPATIEFMDQQMMRIIEDYAHAGLPVQAGAALIIEVDGFPESLDVQANEIEGIVRQFTSLPLEIARDAAQRERIWYGRKSAAGAMARLAPAYYLLDGTVPRSKLADTLSRITQACQELDLSVAYVLHAGDGNFHPFILIPDPSNPELMQRIHQAGKTVMDICVSQDGSITGEHGVGLEKRQFMPLMFNSEEIAAMQEIKSIFDPRNLLNPGKIFPESSPVSPQRQQLADGKPLCSDAAPNSAAEAAQFIQGWLAAGQSVRIRGGGSKSNRLAPAQHQLSTRGLAGIERLALDDLYITVKAGTSLVEIQAELAAHHMWLPLLSPWAEATIGGMLSTNFNAPLRMRYGSLRDLLLAAEVVLPDGRILHTGRPVVKNVAGYDLPKLFVGAQGSLGLITNATLKLAPCPRLRLSLVLPVDHLSHGLECSRLLLPLCLNAAALLLIPGSSMPGAAPYQLVYTVEGLPEDVHAEIEQARTALRVTAKTEPLLCELSGNDLWADWIRSIAPHQPLFRLGLGTKDQMHILMESAVSLSEQSFCADLANGLFYYGGNTLEKSWLEKTQAAGGYILQLSGTNSGPQTTLAPAVLELMQAIKDRWDARGLFNPEAIPALSE
jgi:D-lactate dehydrogenase (cytochrome)